MNDEGSGLMSESVEVAPKVFISYSHDSPDHKRWVAELANKLMDNGIDIILDQWELGPGDDVPRFMEKSVTQADRVLMICTEKYVQKADEGSGGVGYEAMIVTGELIEDLGTSKFIPIIRQDLTKPLVPKSVSTRLYVNLGNAKIYEDEFERLLRELHNVPSMSKSPLGKRPFPRSADIEGAALRTGEVIPLMTAEATTTESGATYKQALVVIRRQDMIAWRALIREARKPIPSAIAAWRLKYENIGFPSRRVPAESSEEIMDSAAEGIVIYTPLFAIALAGVISAKVKFNNQIAILDEVLHPKTWNRSGSTDIVYLPESAAFVYQALHGAGCLITEQLDLAVRLARARVGEGAGGRSSVPLYKTSEIIGWPHTLGGNSKLAWDFLWKLPERWRWLDEIYGDADDYKAALCAYYMLLNIVELVDCIADGEPGIIEKGNVHLEVPIWTPLMPEEIVRRGYRLLLNSPKQIRDIWESREVSEEGVRRYWTRWMSFIARTMRPDSPFLTVHMIQENLFDDLS